MNGRQPPLLVVVGPTAVGKTEIALGLAERIGGEIINADSRQIYRYMDIGTAKPSPAEQALVPHHLLDIVAPDEDFSLATFLELAGRAISEIHQRSRVPLLVGGTGQYVRAVIEGWQVPHVPPQLALRQRWMAEADKIGKDSLHRRLQALDPGAAAGIDPRNVRRVIRALEVIEVTGRRFSELRQKNPPHLNILTIGLSIERTALYERIDERVEEMIRRGLVDEVASLLKRGYACELPAMSSLGYRQIGQFLRGETDLASAVTLTKFETHRYARQQLTWFRAADQGIHWLAAGEAGTAEAAFALADQILAAGSWPNAV